MTEITLLLIAAGLLGACGAPERRAAPAVDPVAAAAAAAPEAIPPEERTAPAPKPAPPPSPTLAELLPQIDAAYRRGDYPRGLTLVKQAFELPETDVSSMDRIGSIYYVLGRYGEAVSIWSRALPLEKDPEKRRELRNSLTVARRSLGLPDEPLAAAEPDASVAPAAMVDTAAVPAPPQPPAPDSAKKAEVQTLYKQGVKFYASGQYLQAATAFLRVLELDPGNADAKKALKRLQLSQ